MGPNTSRADLLPGMLDAVLSGKARTRGSVTGGARSPIWAIRSAISGEWRDKVARLLPDAVVADLTTRFYQRLDWRRTRAIAVPGENKGYVRVNLAGRERHGIVHPSEVDELLDTISRGLLTFCDPDGSPAITRVERMSEMTSPWLVRVSSTRSRGPLGRLSESAVDPRHVPGPWCGDSQRRRERALGKPRR